MNGGEYIRLLLPRWLKNEDGELWRLTEALGQVADDARSAVDRVRRLWVTETSSSAGLDAIGAGRACERWDDESDAEYRQRLVALFGVRMRAATPAGMVALMASVGHPEAEIVEFGLLAPANFYDGTMTFNGASNYLYDGKARWAEFAVLMDVGPDVDLPTVARWIGQINRAKPAHTRLAYLGMWHPLGDVCTGESGENVTVTSATQARYNGAIDYNGASDYGPTMEVFGA
ncbi:MAG: hypothetical protein HUU55_07695 [Myxococcales bacterium]|nr:hypothetical protein [Myxococcales bacterium]